MMHQRVDRLPALPGPAAWNSILGGSPERTRLEGKQVADFVVVGAGFAGLSAARRLRQLQPTATIMVLEATRVAEGSAGRNSGFMIDLPHDLASEDYAGSGDDRAVIALNRMAIAFAEEAVCEYQINTNYLDKAGKVNGAASAPAEANNTSYARHLASLNEPSEALDAQSMTELTGSGYYRSGLYTPGTVMLQPAGYINGLATGLERQDVTIHENSPVTALTRQGDTWMLQTPNGSVSAGQVILTVNGHLDSFGFAKRKLMQLFLYAVMTPELDAETLRQLGGQARWGITPSDPMGTTIRKIDTGQGGNRIVTRTCATLAPDCHVGGKHVARAAKVMQTKFEDRFPQLRGIKMEHTWAGHLCLTRNVVSLMRELDTGLYCGCVQNGLGTVRGTLTGIGAAELACGVSSKITEAFGNSEEPVTLPPRPFLEIGANAVLRWKEFKARTE